MALQRKTLNQEPGAGEVQSIVWHPTEPLLAVVYTASVVVHSMFSSNSGNDSQQPQSASSSSSSVMVRISKDDNSEVTTVSWNPSMRLLVVVWHDGGITTWTENQKPFEESSVHLGTPTTCAAWHPSGKRLAIGDSSGSLSIWSCDRTGRLSLVAKFTRRNDEISTSEMLSTTKSISAIAFRTAGGAQQSNPLYVACADGVVFSADDAGGSFVDVASIGSPIASIWYISDRDSVVVATTLGTAIHLRQSVSTGKLEVFVQVKLESKKQQEMEEDDASDENDFEVSALKIRRSVAWCSLGVVASLTHERLVRLWHVTQSRSSILSPPQLGGASTEEAETDPIVCLAFHWKTHALAAATPTNLFIWKWNHTSISIPSTPTPTEEGTEMAEEGEKAAMKTHDSWEAIEPFPLGKETNCVTSLAWGGSGERLLASVINGTVEVLSESSLSCSMHEGTAAFLVGPSEIRVERVPLSGASSASSKTNQITSEIGVRWVLASKNSVVVWNGQQCATYIFPEGNAEGAPSLDAVGSTRATALAVHRDRTLAIIVDGRIQLCNTGCVAKQTLSLPPAEGEPILIDIAGDYLAAITSNNVMRLFDLQKREARPYGVSKVVDTTSIGIVSSIAISPDGTRVAMLTSSVAKNQVHVYMAESGRIVSRDCDHGFFPSRVFWDPSFPKLLACEAHQGSTTSGSGKVFVLFSPPESDLNVMDNPTLPLYETVEIPHGCESLLSLHAPSLFFASRDARVESVKLHDFATTSSGTSANAAEALSTRDAVLSFSYSVALGDMDGAYRAIRAVQSTTVWSGMAQMIIKARRGDLLPALAVCLGNIGNARAAAALRASANEKQPEARLAVVAIHLGMLAEAEELLRSCSRWDLLNRLKQNTGHWEESVALAEEHDRVHLRATHFACARYFEAVSDTKKACEEYQRAESHRLEVPRMLSEAGQIAELDKYIDGSGDAKLLQWRGRYSESHGDFEGAVHMYERAADWFSVVRLLCFQGKMEEASAVVEKSGDKAAAYHLARQLEGAGTDESARAAMKLLGRAGALGHAIRVAMEQGLDGDVAALALQGTKAQQLTAARYLEGRSLHDKAAMLYHRAGATARAVALCFKGGLHTELAAIASSLNAHSDPELVIRCADWMMERGQQPAAVPLYISAGQQAKALDICTAYNVPITEELAEKMSPPETDEPARRNRILHMIAKACDHQGNYALAAKTYTKAKDTPKAMKSLIKTGEVEKIVFFAQVSQQAETYAMAANYLQTRDWRSSPELMRHIINFYKKARAMDNLARFYESCAHVEVDEYRNYEKALGAIKEALLYAHRSKTADGPRIVSALEAKAELVQQFLQARKFFQAGQEEQAIGVCQTLVNATAETVNAVTPGNVADQQIVSIGTVYSLLVEYFHSKGDMQQAHALIEQMHSRKINVLQSIPEEVVKSVYTALGQPLGHLLPKQGTAPLDANAEDSQHAGHQPKATAPSAAAGQLQDAVQEELELDGDAGGTSDVEEDIQRQDEDEEEVR